MDDVKSRDLEEKLQTGSNPGSFDGKRKDTILTSDDDDEKTINNIENNKPIVTRSQGFSLSIPYIKSKNNINNNNNNRNSISSNTQSIEPLDNSVLSLSNNNTGNSIYNHERKNTNSITETIKLDIGGTIYKTSLNTLIKYKDSVIAKMFDKKYHNKPNKDGYYFIDRDGTYFKYILNWLRDGKLIIPTNDIILLNHLLNESKYYQLTILTSILNNIILNLNKYNVDTKILNKPNIKRIEQWIYNISRQPNTLSLIYTNNNIETNKNNNNNNNDNKNDAQNNGYKWELLYRWELINNIYQSNINTITGIYSQPSPKQKFLACVYGIRNIISIFLVHNQIVCIYTSNRIPIKGIQKNGSFLLYLGKKYQSNKERDLNELTLKIIQIKILTNSDELKFIAFNDPNKYMNVITKSGFICLKGIEKFIYLTDPPDMEGHRVTLWETFFIS